MRTLIVEDDATVARWLARVLAEEGHRVDVAATGEAAGAMGDTGQYGLMLVDLGLPDRSGTSVIHTVRRAGCTVPILVLTGRADDHTVVSALDAGADDCIAKPVSIDVLRARVRAALRRGGARRREALALGALRLDRLARQARVGDVEVELTPREYALLEHFLQRPEVVVTRSELLARVWGMGFDPGTNVVDAAMSRLRQKLDGVAGAPHIRTVRGAGFVLSARAGASAAA